MKLLKKHYKKIIATALITSMILHMVINPSIAEASRTELIVKNGHKYERTITVNGSKKTIKLTDKNSYNKYRVVYNGGIMKVTKYDFQTKGQYKITTKTTNIKKMTKYCERNEVSAQAYGKKVTMILSLNGRYYWYQTGNSGRDIGYSKVGCIKTYKVKNKKAGSCLTAYTDAIDDSNNYLAAAGTSASVGMLVIALYMSGIGAAIASVILGAAITLDTAGYACLHNCYRSYIKAAKYYDYLKEYAI